MASPSSCLFCASAVSGRHGGSLLCRVCLHNVHARSHIFARLEWHVAPLDEALPSNNYHLETCSILMNSFPPQQPGAGDTVKTLAYPNMCVGYKLRLYSCKTIWAPDIKQISAPGQRPQGIADVSVMQ